MRIGDRVKLIVARGDYCRDEPDTLGENTGTIIGISAKDDEHRSLQSVLVCWDGGRDLVTYGERDEDDPDAPCFYDIEVVTPRLYANVYLYDLGYGGPQEGGWYYDIYAPEAEHCVKCDSEHNAEYVAECLNEWCKAENSDRYPPSSVLSEGHYVVRLEAWPAEPEPSSRPHYC